MVATGIQCLIAGSSRVINYKQASILFPMTPLPTEILHKLNSQTCSKKKLPFVPNAAGAIIGSNCWGFRRGIVRSTGYFPYCCAIDICLKDKSVNAKIFEDCIQITGAKNQEHGGEAMQYIYQHLDRLQLALDKIHSQPDAYQAVINELEEKCRGTMVATEHGLDHLVVVPAERGEGLDADIYDLLISNICEYAYYSEYLYYISSIHKITWIYQNTTESLSISSALLRINYDLGFQVDLTKFAMMFDGLNGIKCFYDNTEQCSVSVKLELTEEEKSLMKRKSKRSQRIPPCHTWQVYISGKVMQTGPCAEIVMRGKQFFLDYIEQMRDDITF